MLITSVLLTLALLAGCGTKKTDFRPESPAQLTPEESLRQPCRDPTLLPSVTTEDDHANGRAWQKAYKDCKARMQAIIDWYIDLGANL